MDPQAGLSQLVVNVLSRGKPFTKADAGIDPSQEGGSTICVMTMTDVRKRTLDGVPLALPACQPTSDGLCRSHRKPSDFVLSSMSRESDQHRFAHRMDGGRGGGRPGRFGSEERR